jgi:HCO3- transporter family
MLPMPVLYGVFLFMGLASLAPIQMWHRVLLWFQQPSLYPQTCYTTYMEKKRVHLYTVCQLLMFGLIFVVQNIPAISIIFPIMTLLCIPTRMFLFPRIFAGWELELLDGDDDTIAKWIDLKEKSMTPQGAAEWEDVKKDPASQSVSINV